MSRTRLLLLLTLLAWCAAGSAVAPVPVQQPERPRPVPALVQRALISVNDQLMQATTVMVDDSLQAGRVDMYKAGEHEEPLTTMLGINSTVYTFFRQDKTGDSWSCNFAPMSGLPSERFESNLSSKFLYGGRMSCEAEPYTECDVWTFLQRAAHHSYQSEVRVVVGSNIIAHSYFRTTGTVTSAVTTQWNEVAPDPQVFDLERLKHALDTDCAPVTQVRAATIAEELSTLYPTLPLHVLRT